MRIAVLSDVHSNLHALEAVLRDIEEVGVDTLAFLGDAVGYNAHPQQCVELLSEHAEVAVLGNHDDAVLSGGEEWFNEAARAGVEHSRRELDDLARGYLSKLPLQASFHGIHLVHGSPRNPTTEYVFPDTHPEALEEIVRHPSVGEDDRIVAMGHTHVPFVREVTELVVTNVGSVGQPRDGDPRACYAIIEPDTLDVTHRRVPYDVEAAADAVRKAGLPTMLAERLAEGR